ncbi:MAG: hypothetical protein SWE60_05625 [Thermodesulfobacteriota bacterium]|nr:hypothetical protein [Thermodesulfobacteriota bacterium]
MKRYIVMNRDIQGKNREGEPPEYVKGTKWLYRDAPLGPRAWAEYKAVLDGQYICLIVDEKGDPIHDYPPIPSEEGEE